MERQLICSRGGRKEGEESETGSFLLSLALSVIAGASLIEPLHCDRRSLPSCAAPVGERAGAGCGARGESSLPLRHRARPPASPCPPTMTRRMLGSRCVDVSGREGSKGAEGKRETGEGGRIDLSLPFSSAQLRPSQALVVWRAGRSSLELACVRALAPPARPPACSFVLSRGKCRRQSGQSDRRCRRSASQVLQRLLIRSHDNPISSPRTPLLSPSHCIHTLRSFSRESFSFLEFRETLFVLRTSPSLSSDEVECKMRSQQLASRTFRHSNEERCFLAAPASWASYEHAHSPRMQRRKSAGSADIALAQNDNHLRPASPAPPLARAVHGVVIAAVGRPFHALLYSLPSDRPNPPSSSSTRQQPTNSPPQSSSTLIVQGHANL